MTMRTDTLPCPPPPDRPHRRLRMAVSLWLVGIATGLGFLFDYDSTPGGAGDPPSRWPEASALERPAGRPVLVLFAHPRCPCTRASLHELERLQARCQRLCSYVVFCVPAAAPADWCQSDLWQEAAAIPGVNVHRDAGSVETHRFRAVTSGHALLYDGDGALAFTGGITASRGHAGDNAGADAIASVAAGAVPAVRRTAVYGCALDEQDPAGAPAWR